MNRIILIIIIFAIGAFAGNGYDYTDQQLYRIANSLERIANLMEKQYYGTRPTVYQNTPTYRPEEPTIKKTYDSKVNGRSLKAIPTEDMEVELTCEEQCSKDNFSTLTIEKCVKEKCGIGLDN